MDEPTFTAQEAAERGHLACALGASVVTRTGAIDALEDAVRDAVLCRSDDDAERPTAGRLHHVETPGRCSQQWRGMPDRRETRTRDRDAWRRYAWPREDHSLLPVHS